MTYIYCKKVIENGTYGTKEEMLIKLDVFLLNNRITQEQYNELVSLLPARYPIPLTDREINILFKSL